ncbi:MAG: bifunctional demethylmenaquinone methyltransferase/2-methoxy-6-polyprenyl-1,4-benzoquinol methylase UbiE [Proteobacteria bacterium]|jgi:demethylmenaquinone methyltransferase/2-methoxy-6-polyprenyl-1,4-benzoquinol methylase|nr:bifunctional demethylmenaquinone methyltransferase/2-methoxy-6-polyprenyl-1,4-benzoquinol methylase UbiE [Alphaproteobacteria bacterium]NCC03849.1 bifunctional demethylmenaquinone methyltransferase/2-methoxy-6-polyprenyl-1,4-benzoquinol methylase UbiE [Pseudomonadota bacterium]
MTNKPHTTPNPEAEWFGYRQVSPEEKTQGVIDVFSSVADKYDLMNDCMSGGLHRLWKDMFVAKLRPRAGEKILDVAGGTGDITRRCLRKTQGQCNITVCDLNPDMIRVGQKRTIDAGWLNNVAWVVGNAEALPFDENSMDAVCITFGLRNVTHIDTALREFFRVLKPGGRFFCMEFSSGVRPPLNKLYDMYSFTVLPWLGEKVAQDRESYQYLAESIRQFPPQQELANRMEKAGFERVRFENILGGIVAIHHGWKL